MFYILFISFSVAGAVESCGSLMQSRCLSCHFETRICQKLRKNKGKRSWKRTVKSMVRHGAELTSDEQKTLVLCFAEKEAGILSLCNMDN
jgi:hypothetical protein